MNFRMIVIFMNFLCLIGILSTFTITENMFGFIVYSIGYIITMYILSDNCSFNLNSTKDAR